MQISKAVITAAGEGQRRLPLQRFVGIDGVEKAALEILIEEILSAGVDKICLVARPGDEPLYSEAAGPVARQLVFVSQSEQRGYGDALFRSRDFVAGEPFVHLVSDHLYISHETRRCVQQLVAVAEAEQVPISAAQATRESMLPYYGTVGGRRWAGRTDLYEIDLVREKPSPTEAEQSLLVPGLRAGHYLCLFGMHVLTPTVFELLEPMFGPQQEGPVVLSPALAAHRPTSSRQGI